MPTWDFKCVECGAVVSESFCCLESAQAIGVYCHNPDCHSQHQMVRQPCAPNFKIDGYNEKNGYSK